MGIPTISMAWMERPTLRCELRLALLMLMAYAMATSGEDGVHPLRAEEDDSAPLDLFLELSGTWAPMANVTATAAAKKSQDVATASAASDAANADFANAAKLLMSHTHKIEALTKKAKEAVKGGKDEKERHAEGVDADAANSKEETEQAADNVRETKEAAKEAIGEWHKAAKEQQRAASSAIGKAQLEASAHRAKAQMVLSKAKAVADKLEDKAQEATEAASQLKGSAEENAKQAEHMQDGLEEKHEDVAAEKAKAEAAADKSKRT